MGVIEIGYPELLLATGFILASALISLLLSLGFVKSLLIATVRTYLQLIALGFALRWVFGVDSAWLVIGILGLMIVMGTHTALGRAKGAPTGIFFRVLDAVFISGVTVTFAVTALVIRVEPWYKAQYILPIAGMVVGNSMSGLSLGLERLFSDLRKRADEIQMLLSLGATPWEASKPSIRAAMQAALIPIINSMSAVGIVFIPGMMTGQVLAGVDPLKAAAYQIVVMLMISAATAMGSSIAVLGTYRKAFDHQMRFILENNP